MSNSSAIPSWQNCAYVTKRQTAAIFGRSTRWVNLAVQDKDLVAIRQRPGAPQLICVESIHQLLEHLRVGTSSPIRPAAVTEPFGPPRLVWINPKL